MNNQERQPKYRIGTQFRRIGKGHPRLETVIDIHTTRNTHGDLAHFRYVCSHDFMGQVVVDSDVVEASIARGQIEYQVTEIPA